MKKNRYLLTILFVAASLSSCGTKPQKLEARQILNGGFETGNLDGWTIEYGDAFDDDSITSRRTFQFIDDAEHQDIGYNHTGNWYLCGKGYDLSRRNARTGAIRSSNFVLDEDGVIAFKLAGGAIAKAKGENSPLKSAEKRCYLGV